MAWNAVNTDTVQAYTQDIERSGERGLMRNRACYAAKTWTMDERTPRPLEMVERSGRGEWSRGDSRLAMRLRHAGNYLSSEVFEGKPM